MEVVVAFAMLALLLPLLFRTVSSGLDSADRARRRAVAAMLAESALAAVGIDTPLRPGTETGRFGDGYAWRLDVRLSDHPANAVPGLKARMFDTAVTVSWGSGPNGGAVTLETVKLVPDAPW